MTGQVIGSSVIYLHSGILQGWLYKRSNKPLSKDWQKKYVTLLDDGRLTYHSSLNVRALFQSFMKFLSSFPFFPGLHGKLSWKGNKTRPDDG